MLKQTLSPFAERAYSLLRIAAGSMFAFHGLQKVFGVLGKTQPFGTQMWFGGVIELVAGLAIAIGLFTRCAAFVASGTMAVAYAQFHWKFQGGAQLLPGINGGEPAALYAWLFFFFACKGAGPWSVDERRSRATKPA